MTRLKDTSKTPPKGFSWFDPLTGYSINTRNYSNLISQIRDHRVANALPIPDAAEIEEQMCGRFSDSARKEFCEEVGRPAMHGPGWHLHSILSGFGINACWGCIDLARKMDSWGADGCESRMEEIIETIDQNASERKWVQFIPFREAGARLLVERAIERTRREKDVEVFTEQT